MSVDVLVILLFTNPHRIYESSLVVLLECWLMGNEITQYIILLHLKCPKISFIMQYYDVLMVLLFTNQYRINESSLVIVLEFWLVSNKII